TAAAHGAVIANNATARGLGKTGNRISSIKVEDTLDHRSFDLRAKVLVNATGVWADEVSQQSDATAPKKLRPSKGIHIVIPAERFHNQTAVLIPSLGERRFLFVIPWHGRTVIGTTDTDYEGDLDDPSASADEVNRVVRSAKSAFPAANLSGEDVISSFAGLRPLIKADQQSTKELSRKEEIFEDESGLITITGGKLTTWRRMAERVVDVAVGVLARADGTRRTGTDHSVTERIKLAGGTAEGATRKKIDQEATTFGVAVATVEHLMDTYGGNYRVLLDLTRESEELKEVLEDGLPHIGAEVVYAARFEMATTSEDFLARRTRIALLSRDNGRACVTRVTSLMARELGRQD
ncbi:MAG: FAD-dependent oxidoreductase, partial [Acidobacteriota bacterium]